MVSITTPPLLVAVGGNPRQRQRGIHRGDVDDRPSSLGEQRTERHAGSERAGEIDVEHLHEGLDFEFLVARENPGAVDQRVDALVLSGERGDSVVVRDVERCEREPGTRFQQGARKIGLVGTCCSHRCAEVAKLVADCGADVAGPADHHGMKAGGKRKA
ncbi:hypothetical protein ACVWWG_006141 [Bradyrhizobium sp. LB7.2]